MISLRYWRVIVPLLGMAIGFAVLAGTEVAAWDESSQAPEADAESIPYIPDNPLFAAYILKRLTNEELLRAPRKEVVNVAILERAGLDAKHRRGALAALAKERKTDALTELVAGIKHLDESKTENEAEVRDLQRVQVELLRLLAEHKPSELLKHRSALASLATGAARPITRRVALVGLLLADRSVDKVWSLAAEKPRSLVDLLEAVPLVENKQLKDKLYPHVAPLLVGEQDEAIRRTAIRAVVTLPGHNAETFATLAQFVAAGKHRATAIDAMKLLPQESWPVDELKPLADAIVNYVSGLPAKERTTEEATAAFALAADLAAQMPGPAGAKIAAALESVSVRVIPISAVHEQMMYDKKVLVVQAGRPIELVFSNDDIMPHNLVLTRPGKWEDVGLEAELMAAQPDAAARQFIPETDDILYASQMLQPQQVEKIAFSAPAEPGVYPYVCTFPGHWRRMYGALVVVENVDAYLAENKPLPAAEELLGTPKVVKEWKVGDLLPEVDRLSAGRSYSNGKKLFLKAACFGCHTIGGAGGKIGPELTKVAKKYKPHEIVTEVLEPSKKLDPKFATLLIYTLDGKVIRGTVVEETDTEYKLMENPLLGCEPIVVNKDDIDEAVRSKLSPMPVGLLNILEKEEILDLLAYVLAGGNPNHPSFE